MVDLIDDPRVLAAPLLQPKDGQSSRSVRPKALASFSQNLTRLADGLKFGNVADLQDWLNSRLFDRYWQVYLEDCLIPRREAAAARGGQLPTGESFKEVRAAIKHGQSNGFEKYSDFDAEKDGWDNIDHAAWFLYQCTKKNLEHRDGAFYGKGITGDAAYHAIWQAKMYMTAKTQKAKNAKSGNRTQNPTNTSSSEPARKSARTNTQPRGGSNRRNVGDSGASNDSERVTGVAQSPNVEPNPIRSSPTLAQQPEIEAEDDDDDDDDDDNDEDEAEDKAEDEPPPNMTDPGQGPNLTVPKAGREANEGVDDRSPTDTAWDIIIDERQNRPFDLKLRYWQLVVINSVIRPLALPGYVSEYLESVINDPASIQILNAESANWEREVNSIVNKQFIPTGHVSAEDIRRFEHEEQYLNTTPIINVDLADLTKQLRLVSGDRPRFARMPRSVVLSPLQVVGIYEILVLRVTLKGAMLADSMGLGKTIQMIGVVLFDILTFERHVSEGKSQQGDAKPALFVVPAHLVTQICKEIEKFTTGLEVMKYFGDERKRGSGSDKSVEGLLHKDHPLFKDTSTAHKKIVVTSYATLNARHGPSKLMVWREQQGATHKAAANMMHDPDWTCPHLLPECFRTVCVDEAHLIKRSDSQLSMAVQWLQPFFTFLATATPGVNSYRDWAGYLPFVQPRKKVLNSEGRPYTDASINPYVEKGVGNRKPLLRLNQAMATRHIFENPDRLQAGMYLKLLQKECMVRRTYTTNLNGENIGASLPKLFRRSIDLDFGPDSLESYRIMSITPLRRLIIVLEDGRLSWNQKHARTLILNATWLGFDAIKDNVYAEHITKHRRDANMLHNWLRKVQDSRGGPDRYNLPDVSDTIGQVASVCAEAPKISCMLAIVADSTIRHKEKVVVWVCFPAEQLLCANVLQRVGVDARALTSDMNLMEREELLTEFNTEDTSAMVLILSYSTSSSGLNLHYKSHVTIHMDHPFSQAIKDQADGRQRRIGAISDVISWSLAVNDTFNDRQYQNMLTKAMPGIMAELNDTLFNVKATQDETGTVDVVIEGWVMGDGQLMKADSELAANARHVRPLNTQEVVDALLDISTGKKVTFE